MEKTTIILGAGANKEINLSIDVGPEFIRNISDRVTGMSSAGQGLCKALENQFPHLNHEKRNDFLIHLDKYMSSTEGASIDGFLQEVETFPEFESKRKDFIDIGLLMIFGHVVGWEGSDTKTAISEEHTKRITWLSVLHDFMNRTQVLDRRGNRELNIITFNYDRILEQFLVDGFDEYKARVFIKEHVFHVYGRIAKLDTLDENFKDEQNMNMGWPNDDFTFFSTLTKNISLIRQKVDTEIIKDKVKNSHKLVVMGYGFDPINNRRLGLHDWKNENDQNLIFNIYPGPNQTGISLPGVNWQTKSARSA